MQKATATLVPPQSSLSESLCSPTFSPEQGWTSTETFKAPFFQIPPISNRSVHLPQHNVLTHSLLPRKRRRSRQHPCSIFLLPMVPRVIPSIRMSLPYLVQVILSTDRFRDLGVISLWVSNTSRNTIRSKSSDI